MNEYIPAEWQEAVDRYFNSVQWKLFKVILDLVGPFLAVPLGMLVWAIELVTDVVSLFLAIGESAWKSSDNHSDE